MEPQNSVITGNTTATCRNMQVTSNGMGLTFICSEAIQIGRLCCLVIGHKFTYLSPINLPTGGNLGLLRCVRQSL